MSMNGYYKVYKVLYKWPLFLDFKKKITKTMWLHKDTLWRAQVVNNCYKNRRGRASFPEWIQMFGAIKKRIKRPLDEYDYVLSKKPMRIS